MKSMLEKYPELTEGISSLYTYQEKAISNILNGQNTLVIAPTGKGKSLIYQLASQELTGISLVISPLIALINEQVSFLKSKGVNCLALTGEIPFSEQRIILRDLASNCPKLIFLSPERLQNYLFKAALKRSNLKIDLIAIDEAHCISQWGIDFRPDYGQIKSFLIYLKGHHITPVVLALTATLGVEARKDIIREFHIPEKNENVIIEDDIIRPELHLHFMAVGKECEKPGEVLRLLEQPQNKVLIYFYSIPKSEEIAEMLKERGISSDSFHAKKKAEEKTLVYNRFKSGELRVLCATTAFGMGMNIPDIDTIIHYQIPNSIEEYYQQVGRAARDKSECSKAECYLLWSEKNFTHKLEDQIPGSTITVDHIKDAFRKLGLENNSNKPQSIEYSDYIKQGLSIFRHAFESRGVLSTIGELNGTPKSIEFVNQNKKWDSIVKKMRIGNSYVRAAKNSGMDLEELIDYVLVNELNGNIKKFPALEKKIFLISPYDQVPIELMYEIVEESMKIVAFKQAQVKSLKEMITSSSPEHYIDQYFIQSAVSHS